MQRQGYNHLSLVATKADGTVIPETRLGLAQGVTFKTLYTAGLFGAMSLTVPRDVRESLLMHGAHRLLIYNGLTLVWEGALSNVLEGGTGSQVEGVGPWGTYLKHRGIHKRWVDNRIGQEVWRWDTSVSGAEKCNVDRYNRIRLTPKAELWTAGQLARVRYTMPTGQTIKRISMPYSFREQAIVTPSKVWHYDSAGPTYTDLTNTYDGDGTTNSAVTITTGDYVYVDVIEGTGNIIYFFLGSTFNNNASVMTAEYPSEDTAGNITWNALTITDGTIASGKTLRISGGVSFTRPADLVETSVNGVRKPWVRLIVSANLTAGVTINEISIREVQAWELRLRDPVGGVDLGSVTTDGDNVWDVTLGTPRQYLDLELVARANQTPPSNGTIYGQVSGEAVKMYSETGNIDAYEVANDVRGGIAELSGDVTGLSVGTAYSLEPLFITKGDGREFYGEILARAASFGEGDGLPFGYGVRSSQLASDGKPLLFLEAWPGVEDVESYEYQVWMRTAAMPEIRRDYAWIENWISVQYTDYDGRARVMTPDDFADLKSTSSIAKWGQRESPPLQIGQVSESLAYAYGVSYLAAHKDPLISASGPIVVREYILHRKGFAIPASEIQAGKRVRLMDYEEGLTGVVVATEYRHEERACALTLGVSDHLAVVLAGSPGGAGGHGGIDAG